MAITINIRYSGSGDNAKQFAREMLSGGVVEEIRAEKGNLRYEYYLPLEDDGTVLLIDSWADQAVLDAHHDSPAMAKIIALREKYDLHMRVERYVSDGAGVPEKDNAFIRE